MSNVNARVLDEISERSPTAEAFFTYAASREREVKNGVSRLPAIRQQMAKEGFHPFPQDLLSMFRELERAGVGELKGDTFKWRVSIKEVGKSSKVERKPQLVKEETPEITTPRPLKSLVIFFDKEKEVELSFPANLSKDEIKFVMEKLLNECR